MTMRLLPLLLVLCLLSGGPALAGDADRLLDFADHLFAQKDYYRAVTEYKRFLYLHPDDPAAPSALLRMTRAYLAGERWQEADATVDELLKRYPESREAGRAALLSAEVAFRQRNFSLARQRYGSAGLRYPELAGAADYRIAWCLLEEGDIDQARRQLEGLEAPQGQALADDLGRFATLPRKSPATAGLLSAVLPGAGQVYTGHARDGAIAFALNVAFILAGIEAFDNGNEALGGILAFVEVGWYAGNIFNAVTNAHKSNRRLERGLLDELRQKHGLDLALGPRVGLIRLSWRF
ncbi:MAG: hypothetical protein Kow00100_12470 [Geothermobacteraceae bacterium]